LEDILWPMNANQLMNSPARSLDRNRLLFREGKVRVKKPNDPVERIKVGVGVALLATLTGCVGFVGGGRGGVVFVPPPPPEVVLFGGGYERGHDVHVDSHRGFESRREEHERH
jgi:hypothetical protein